MAASVVVPGIAPATHTRLTRASVDNDGGYSGWSIEHPSLSGDGRRVAFDVYGSLLPEDRNYNYHDVYVRDLDAEMTTLVSVAPDGGPAYGNHTSPVISGNGRFVAFVSDSPDLVAGDTNGVADVFVRDLEAGTTQRVSLGDDGQEASDASETASISDDGRVIAFVSHASNLVSGDDNIAGDVFVRDVGAGTTTIESVSTGGDIADAGVSEAAISGDGNIVAFATHSTNLAPGDTSTCGMRLPPVNCEDVYARKRSAGTTMRVTNGADGSQSDGPSWNVTLSANGARIAFTSTATNLVAGDTPSTRNVFVADTSTGTITLATPTGDEGSSSDNARIRRDGSVVIFESFTGGISIRNLEAGSTYRPKFTNSGTQGNARARAPSISDDGRHVAFSSDASDLGPNNGSQQAYVYDLAPAPTEIAVRPAFIRGTPSIHVSARLTELGTNEGLGGRTVRFLAIAGSVELCRATTNVGGYASCGGFTPELALAIPGYTAVFDGDDQFSASYANSGLPEAETQPQRNSLAGQFFSRKGIS